ncbi:MAG: OB-fold nucleic acid binding domain-containing protein [Planctomycetota bacterium]
MTNNNKVSICELKNNVDQEVTLSGWLYKGRSSGKIQFLIIRDGTGLCQCTVEKGKIPDELFEQLKRLGQESSLTISGIVRAAFCSRTAICTCARSSNGASEKSGTPSSTPSAGSSTTTASH